MDLKSPEFEEMRLQFEAEAIKHIEDEKKLKKKRNITKIGKLCSYFHTDFISFYHSLYLDACRNHLF